jgi:3,4-dihydroxy 2-butanone 4-phosphate synthase / GTP cyclohydrolase II
MQMNTIEEIIEDIRLGKMVVLMDDEDRENEGDLIMAASHCRPEDINFMAKFGRGLICMPMTGQRCEQLNLPLMVDNNGAAFSTNFTVSIEAREGVSTGISAADRARTVQAAVGPNAAASDIVQPGHIFPLRAVDGGVLNRAGHTEAGCDLARLAGQEPAAVIVEILNEDGTMARRPELEVFAKQHDLKIGTIADLIEYRSLNEKSIEKMGECQWPTKFGDFQCATYKDTIDGNVHFAMIKGDIPDDEPTIVRVHVEDKITDILHGERASYQSWSLTSALEYVAKQSHGVVVIIGNQEIASSVMNRMKRFIDEDLGVESSQQAYTGAIRNIGIGSQILSDLGINQFKLLSEPKKYHAISGFNLEIVDFISCPE